jgi:hypothetical protein
MLALQPLTTTSQPGNPSVYYIFMTALVGSGHVRQKNSPFNNFRTTDLRSVSQAFGCEPNAWFERD